MAKKPQLWSGRFSEPVDERVKRFTASVGFDRRLAEQDIAGSIAHARMLAACGLIARRDLKAIERGLAAIHREIRAGRFAWSIDAEDVHLNIERRLVALVGEPGKRLHTARSRNDQVATDLRLWLRGEIDVIAAELIMVHLSRLAEELVLWASPRFGFVRLPERYSTGSSIMPQKKNPDVPELVRGKSGRVFGSLVALLALMKGQPLAYNKDNQEDKQPLFDAADTVRDCLAVCAGLMAGLSPVPKAMRAAALEGHAT